MINAFRTRLDAQKNEGGFTLIELLIVIVILGVLAAIVVFAVGGITDKGDTAACKSDLKTTEVAAEAYYAQHGAYTDVAGLVAAKLIRSTPGHSVTVALPGGAVTATGC